MILKGKVYKYGADVNTDVIIPARYLNVSDPDELAQHCMEDIDADFLKTVKPGDIIMAFRNAINIGLPLLECPQAIDNTDAGDVLEIDLARGEIKNVTKGMEFTAEPYPEFMAGLISAGGLIEYTKKRLDNAKA